METSKGYVFGTKLKTSAIEGVARTTHDMMTLNHIFAGEHQISNHDDGFIIRDAKRKIAAAIGIDENISNNALRILFGPMDLQMSLFSQDEIEFEKMETEIRSEFHRNTELAYARKEGREEGIGIGREEGIGIGREEGIGIGRKEGEEKLNQLYLLLIKQNRMDDLQKAAEDKAFRQKLYQEFGLE